MGTRGTALSSLFDEERYAEAAQHLERARQADPDNKFVIDYEVQVAIAQGDFGRARTLLTTLERVEDTSRYNHRLSRLESAEGNHDAAFAAAKEAFKAADRPQFEVISQFVNTALRVGRIDDAREGLTMLSQRFRSIRSGIQDVLWTRYYLITGSPRDALVHWDKLSGGSKASHRNLGEELLAAMTGDGGFSAAEREKVRKSLS